MKVNVDEFADEQLMELVQKGKFNYMETLFTKYKTPLYNYFLKCTASLEDSKDLTQIVFVRVMKYRNSFDSTKTFRVWIFQIARNLVKDHFRKLKIHHDQFSAIEILPEYEDDNLTKEQLEREELLHVAISKLPPDKRELIVMSKFQGLKYEEIARIRDVTVSAIKVQVHRTMSQLRNLFFEENEKI